MNNNPYKKDQDQQDEVNQFLQDQLSRLEKVTTEQKLALGKAHKRILSYFWNNRRNEIRSFLPLSAINFFESENWPESQHNLTRSQVSIQISELLMKGYIENVKPENGIFRDNGDTYYSLTKQGDRYMMQLHPPVLSWWTWLLSQTPGYVTLSIASIGVISVGWDIVDHIMKYFCH